MDVERFFQVMGDEAHLRVLGDEPEVLVAQAENRLAELEARWTRWLPGSDVARVNAADGEPTRVAVETVDMVDLAVQAWLATGGRFDPSVTPALVAAGQAADDRGTRHQATRAPGLKGIIVDRDRLTVVVPEGTQLDFGGIVKGRAADVVAEELLAAGATGACVNVGGDVRVAGLGPLGASWTVAVEHPLDGGDILMVALDEGAVATSTAIERDGAERRAHRLIDPATGEPARTDLVSVTVLASEAAWAGVVAKAALLSGAQNAPSVIARFGLTGLLVDADGTAWTLPGLDDYLA